MDSETDYLIMLEPGNLLLYGWVNGELKILGAGSAAYDAMKPIFESLLPYAQKNYCMVANGIAALCPVLNYTPNSADCNAEEVEAPKELVYFHDNLTFEKIKSTNRRISSNYCTKVVIFKPYRLSSLYKDFINEGSLHPAFLNYLKGFYGNEFVLFVAHPKSGQAGAGYDLSVHTVFEEVGSSDSCFIQAKNNIAAIKELAKMDDVEKAVTELEKILQADNDPASGSGFPCEELLGDITEVETTINENYDVEIIWNEVENAEYYYVIITPLNNNNGIGKRTKNIDAPYFEKANGQCILKLRNNPAFDLPFGFDEEYYYSIYPMCASMEPDGSEGNITDLSIFPKGVSLSTGNFQHQPQRVCLGQVARLGIAYKHNKPVETCTDNEIYPQVNPDIYSFVWTGPELPEPHISYKTSQNELCEACPCGEDVAYPSRTEVIPTLDGVYQLERSQNTVMRKPDGTIYQKDGQSISVTATDRAQVKVESNTARR